MDIHLAHSLGRQGVLCTKGLPIKLLSLSVLAGATTLAERAKSKPDQLVLVLLYQLSQQCHSDKLEEDENSSQLTAR